MKTKLLLTVIFLSSSLFSLAQNGWTICNTPVFSNRVDDIFMCNSQIGYAVCGDGKIVKTTNGGNDWNLLIQDSINYLRSVEFMNEQKGFVGAFPGTSTNINILRKTTDGGITWTDITSLIDPKAQYGICGLAIGDSNTIYGCGNWYQDSAYIVKSIDGGNTWNFIDMSFYASSLIDMYFLNKDTGFATGRGPLPLKTAIILYTTDGGQTWMYKFQNTTASEYCWKIQHLTDQIYFASIEDFTSVPPKILKSIDGGMSWSIYQVTSSSYNLEGVGFIDSLKGWTGGGFGNSFESNDGGISWNSINICPSLNRVFKVNDSLLFASGDQIWKYTPMTTGITPINNPTTKYASLNCNPNPANDHLTITISLFRPTHALLMLLDVHGKQMRIIENADKLKGDFQYQINMSNYAEGMYYVVLKTHEDKEINKIVLRH